MLRRAWAWARQPQAVPATREFVGQDPPDVLVTAPWLVDARAAVVFVTVAAGVVLASRYGVVGQSVALGLASLLFTVALVRRYRTRREIAFFLLLPTILSATQNLFVVAVARDLSPSQTKFFFTVNVLLALIILVVLGAGRTTRSGLRRGIGGITLVCLITLTVYGLGSAVVVHSKPLSALASLRNVATPMLFMLIGLCASRLASLKAYLRGLVALGILVMAFGIVELSVPNLWQDFGIKHLWDNKGLLINRDTGLPPNYYSSEMLRGHQLRRMVASFADPINLGTFLFALSMACWRLRRRALVAVVLVASVLAVSKGALLSQLVFAACWARYRASRTVLIATLVVVAGAGLAFYGFTLRSSTGSTAAHVGGLVDALVDLPQHPFGRGLGKAGVLASLFGEGSGSVGAESGIGVVVSQLGVVGLGAYGAFFFALAQAIKNLDDLPDRVLVVTLLVAFILNGAFDEVAFSPNSAAPYFLIIGLVLGRIDRPVGREVRRLDSNRACPS